MSNKQALYILFIAGLASFLLTAGLTGCTAETAGASGIPANKPVPVVITLATEKTTVHDTKSASGPFAPTISSDDQIHTLDIYILNDKGEVEAHADEADFTTATNDGNKGTFSSTLELLPGEKTVYAFANCEGDAFADLALSSGWTTGVPEAVSNNTALDAVSGINTTNGIPMSAYTTWRVTEAADAAYSVKLVRMVAQMEITIEDERGEQTNKITSLTIGKLLPATTRPFRTATGKDDLPGNATTPAPSDWTWTRPAGNTAPPSIDPFYLHETTGTFDEFDVSMGVEGETAPRTTTLHRAIPRNRIYPLTIHLCDYALDITGSYLLAAIGTVAVETEIGNGYTIELPEGCSDVKINIQLKENGKPKQSNVTWSCTTLPAYLQSNSSGANATLELTSAAVPAIVGGGQAGETVTVTAEFTSAKGQSLTRTFPLTFRIIPLTDDAPTKAGRPSRSASPREETQPIVIEL